MGHTEIKGDVFLANDKIIIHGAREHNLKNVDVEIPRDKLIVFTGLSGSGKSSLGAKAVCRIAFIICAPVFRANGKA